MAGLPDSRTDVRETLNSQEPFGLWLSNRLHEAYLIAPLSACSIRFCLSRFKTSTAIPKQEVLAARTSVNVFFSDTPLSAGRSAIVIGLIFS
jgi:hypothetical protein